MIPVTPTHIQKANLKQLSFSLTKLTMLIIFWLPDAEQHVSC